MAEFQGRMAIIVACRRERVEVLYTLTTVSYLKFVEVIFCH